MDKSEVKRAHEIGARIKGRRLELGLTQEGLAERAGTVSYTHLTLPTSDLV